MPFLPRSQRQNFRRARPAVYRLRAALCRVDWHHKANTHNTQRGCYTDSRIAHRSLAPVSAEPMRRWRNWQTHKLEVLAPQGIGVQVPSSAPIQHILSGRLHSRDGRRPRNPACSGCVLSNWRCSAPAGQVRRSRCGLRRPRLADRLRSSWRSQPPHTAYDLLGHRLHADLHRPDHPALTCLVGALGPLRSQHDAATKRTRTEEVSLSSRNSQNAGHQPAFRVFRHPIVKPVVFKT